MQMEMGNTQMQGCYQIYMACIYNIDYYRSFGVERRNLVDYLAPGVTQVLLHFCLVTAGFAIVIILFLICFVISQDQEDVVAIIQIVVF